jgi:hypothetical protein
MGVDGLDPRLRGIATQAGTAAAQAIKRGDRPRPCQWRADTGSLTAARMAAAWSDAFNAAMGDPKPLPE